MKYPKIKRVYFEHSNKWVCEKHKHLLPAIEFYGDQIGIHCLWSFKFVWWSYWFKIYISFFVWGK